jgi:hypothetical protein
MHGIMLEPVILLFCELNYTPEGYDGSIDPKAISIAESFEVSRQFYYSTAK